MMDELTFYQMVQKALTHPAPDATIDFLYSHGVADVRVMKQPADSPLLWQDEDNGCWYTLSDIDHMAAVDGTAVFMFTNGQPVPTVKGVDLSKMEKDANAPACILRPMVGFAYGTLK